MNNTLIIAPVFFVVSALFSMLGMGGGILYVPILIIAGYSMTEAPAISLMLSTIYGIKFNKETIKWKTR